MQNKHKVFNYQNCGQALPKPQTLPIGFYPVCEECIQKYVAKLKESV